MQQLSPYVLYEKLNHSPKTKEDVPVKCPKCGNVKTVRFASHLQTIRKNNGKYLCHKCSIDPQKCSENVKKAWKNKEYADKMRAHLKSDRMKDIMRERNKRLFSDPQYVEFWKSRANKEKTSNAIKELWKNDDYKNKMRKIISERMKKQWRNPEFRNLMMKHIEDNKENMDKLRNSDEFKEMMRTLWKDEDYKKRMGKCRELWKDPEYRIKMQKIRENPEFIEKIRKIWENHEYKGMMRKKWQDPGYKLKMAQVRLNQPKTSFQQSILYSILDDLKIKYYKDSDKECMVGFYTFDCRIDSQEGIKLQNPLLIEVNGDYWHSLKSVVSKDKSKATYLKSYFPQYGLKYLWEHEFHNKDRIISLIKYWLGLDQVNLVDFNFSNISHKIIDCREAEVFISKYHYAGLVGRSGVNLGYYLGDELIAVIIYSQPVRQETATKQGCKFKEVLELSRLAIHPSYQKKNLASHIISKSIKTVKELRPEIKLLVSFSDATHNHSGTIYKASNWMLDGIVSPDYWYSDPEGYVCHKKTLWNHARKMGMTESQYCELFKYQKIWGLEKIRYIYRI